jgi:hypothetical protein
MQTRTAVLIDQGDLTRSTRGRLKPKRACATKDIEGVDLGPVSIEQVLKPIKERLSHPVRCGAKPEAIGHAD